MSHRHEIEKLHMRELFEQDDATGLRGFRYRWGELMLDYSKNRITSQTMELLFEMARHAGLGKKTSRDV